MFVVFIIIYISVQIQVIFFFFSFSGEALLKAEKVESHEEAIVRHLKFQRIQQLKLSIEEESNLIKTVKNYSSFESFLFALVEFFVKPIIVEFVKIVGKVDFVC